MVPSVVPKRSKQVTVCSSVRSAYTPAPSVGTIKQDGEITLEPTFENGCVRVMDKLYLPTGEEI